VNRPQPRLLALATAVPRHVIGQADVAERARRYYAEERGIDIERLMPVFANTGIEKRYSCVPIEWYYDDHGWVDRNALYLENAVALLEQAARQCLERAGLAPSDIDAVVVVSTTGIATPSLDAILMDRLGLRRDVRRLPIFGFGCAGGVVGLGRAADLARARPESRILFLVVELCALWFRRNDLTKSNIVATALFGDGAVAALVACRGEGPAIGQGGEHTWPQSLDIMGWIVADDGLKALFSRDIPTLVDAQLHDAAAHFLDGQGLGFADIEHFICHPGGAKVLTAIETAYGLGPHALDDARSILRDYGNMSAVTVLFVLERALKRGVKGRMMLTALGPGFTAGFLLIEA
jgi:alkylresorcinol/alkylpyrone synthase